MKKIIPICLALAIVLTGCGSSATVASNEPVELYFIQETDDNGNESYEYSVESDEYKLTAPLEEIRSRGCIIVSADEIKSAEAAYYNSGDQKEPMVNIQFNDAGTKLFAEATQRAVEKDYETIGIYYDGEFISVPSVRDTITDGKCVISGLENYEEAAMLADKLNRK